MKHITSRDNPLFKQLRKLAESSRERRKAGQALLDGAHLAEAYMRAVGTPRQLIVAEGDCTDDVLAVLRQLPQTETVMLLPTLFAELSPVATPTGLLALIDVPQLPLPETVSFALLLEDIQDPGNLGSILRSAAAAGVQAVYLSAGCADAWSPKALRGGQGAHFLLPVIERAPLAEIAAGFEGATLATVLQGRPLYQCKLSGPVAFVIGNEGAGVSEALLNAVSDRVSIPMPGKVESLNAAAAAAICLFERVRQTQ